MLFCWVFFLFFVFLQGSSFLHSFLHILIEVRSGSFQRLIVCLFSPFYKLFGICIVLEQTVTVYHSIRHLDVGVNWSKVERMWFPVLLFPTPSTSLKRIPSLVSQAWPYILYFSRHGPMKVWHKFFSKKQNKISDKNINQLSSQNCIWCLLIILKFVSWAGTQ